MLVECTLPLASTHCPSGPRFASILILGQNHYMIGWDMVLLGAVLLGYAAVSGRLRDSMMSPAIVFVVAGYVLGTEALDLFTLHLASGSVRTLAEVTLALLLFSDASALDTRTLMRETSIPSRLLGIGLPLTILLGAVVAVPLFPDLGMFEAIVLAVLLSPTDAALGQMVVSDKRLPSCLRQGLNVESGLNDGISVPLLFAAVALVEVDKGPGLRGEIMLDLVEEVGIALVVGTALGVVVVRVFQTVDRLGWMDEGWTQVVPLATALVGYGITDELGGSGFIAAFAAGLLYGRLLGSRGHHTTLLTEEVSHVLGAVTFFAFAAGSVGLLITDLDAQTIIYAVLSLTAVRMIPVAIAMIGARLAAPTVLFAGWFGPRGLATIVFMLTIVEESDMPNGPLIAQAATVTVLLSIFAHGITAPWLTNRYVEWFSANEETLDMEAQHVEVGTRRRGFWRHQGNRA